MLKNINYRNEQITNLHVMELSNFFNLNSF